MNQIEKESLFRNVLKLFNNKLNFEIKVISQKNPEIGGIILKFLLY